MGGAQIGVVRLQLTPEPGVFQHGLNMACGCVGGVLDAGSTPTPVRTRLRWLCINAWDTQRAGHDAAQPFAPVGAPHAGSGYGPPWYGTLQEWQAACPEGIGVRHQVLAGGLRVADCVIHRVTPCCVRCAFSNVVVPAAAPTLWSSELPLTGLTRRRLGK
jgi:hypothetical protein